MCTDSSNVRLKTPDAMQHVTPKQSSPTLQVTPVGKAGNEETAPAHVSKNTSTDKGFYQQKGRMVLLKY